MPVIFSSDSDAHRKNISRQVSKGKLVKVHKGIYTDELDKELSEVIRFNLWEIAAYLVPGGVVSHRSANELKISPGGYFFITGKNYKKIEMHGITFVISKGPGPIEGDRKLGDTNLYQSQYERMLLENLMSSRVVKKGLGKRAIEILLKEELIRGGEVRLNLIRDRTRAIAKSLDMANEFKKVDGIIGALLTSQPSTNLESTEAKAMANGSPYDAKRIEMFESLAFDLDKADLPEFPKIEHEETWMHFSFFEAYFSNYIEGTVFTIDEANEIVQSGNALSGRHEDSHDILATNALTSSHAEMSKTPNNPNELMDLLRARHAILLKERKEKHPGLFKERNNRAGDYEFVDHRQVKGTLEMAWKFYEFLQKPVARAYYIMFLTSETHPFDDGNGRIARIMMNSVLSANGLSKILIPNVFRRDYLTALRAMSNNLNSIPYTRMLNRAFKFSSLLRQDNFTEMREFLDRSNSFSDREEDILRFKLE